MFIIPGIRKVNQLLLNKFFISCNNSTSKAFVRTEFKNNVGIIYLCDPTRLNALTVEMGNQFITAVDEMITRANKKEIRTVVITGEGINIY